MPMVDCYVCAWTLVLGTTVGTREYDMLQGRPGGGQENLAVCDSEGVKIMSCQIYCYFNSYI